MEKKSTLDKIMPEDMLSFISTEKGRLDSIISKKTNISRSKVKKLFDDDCVYINNSLCKNPSQRILDGETIHVLKTKTNNTLIANDSPLEIIYQDNDIAIIVKPANLTVHPCPSCEEQTLVHQLLHHFPLLKNMEGDRPGIVHRLDKDTSGLMIIAMHEEARLCLAEAFAQRKINKTYLALVSGLCENAESEESIGRHPTYKTKMAQVPLSKGGKEAHTSWERLYPPIFKKALTKMGKSVPIPEAFKSPFSLMAIKIYTGRTHQIRVHMAEAGYPLLGDKTYAHGSKQEIADMATRQMLHAWKLHFHHPMTNQELSFTCPLPLDFIQTMILQWLGELAFQKIIITGVSGVGKSALLNAFEGKNIPTFSADACVQELYQPHADAWYLLKKQYGQRFVHNDTDENIHEENIHDERVDKKHLFESMQDPLMRKEIENIIHPLVFSRLESFFQEAKNYCRERTKSFAKDIVEKSNKTIKNYDSTDLEKILVETLTQNPNFFHFAAAEIPLWHESTTKHKENLALKDTVNIICVTCDDQKRWERLKKRDWSDDVIASMDSWQWTQDDKAKASNYCINNVDDLTSLEDNAKNILQAIIENKKNILVKKLKTLIKSMSS